MQRYLLIIALLVTPFCVFAEGFEREGFAAPVDDASEELGSLVQLARHGNPQACYHLGLLYLRGTEVEKSVVEAIQWFQRAAERGHVEAEYSLGRIYADGNALEEAVHWYERAAHHGHRRAQNNLGRLYAMGAGVDKDYVTAYKWWLLSSKQGDRAATRNRDKIVQRMTPDQIREGERLARLTSN